MHTVVKRAALCAAASLFALAGWIGGAAAAPADLFSGPAPDGAASARTSVPARAVARQRTVLLNAAAFSAAAAERASRAAPIELRIALFSNAAAVFVESGSEPAVGGGSIWRGTSADGEATLVLARGGVTGQITLGGKTFTIAPAGGATHVVTEVSAAGFPPDGPEMIAPAPKASGPAPDAPVARAVENTEIGMLVAYTRKTKLASPDVVSEINLAVSNTNSAYMRGNIHITLKLLGVQLVKEYDEDAHTFEQALYNVSNQGSPDAAAQLGVVRQRRNTLDADLVSLFIEKTTYCGIAWLSETPGPSTAPLGYSVMSRVCVSNKSFAHELGHNMGLRHDRYVEPTAPNTKYNYGYVNTVQRVRDIMAYNNQCAAGGFNCERVNRF